MTASLEARLQVSSPAELAERYSPNGRLGGLTLEGKAPGALGQRVALRVEVHKPARTFVLGGQLAWARHKPAPNQPAGYGVDFLPEDDATRVRLLAFAREEVSSDAVRAEARHQVELKVRLVHEGRERKETTADLSTGGAFIRTWNPLPVGARVQVFLRPPLSLSALQLDAHVAWVRLAGEHPGMGLEFAGRPEERARLEKLVAKLSR
ncbi:MAG TPA: PilZ domain-containing protein [Archangium sp.]